MTTLTSLLVVQLVPNKWGRSGHQRYYFPIVHGRQFWKVTAIFVSLCIISHTMGAQLPSRMHPIDVTVTHLPLHITFFPTTFFNFEKTASIADAFEKTTENGPEIVASELMEMKRVLIDTPSWLLAATAIFGVLYLV